jgi:UDP-glucose 4-epimerase
VLGDGRQAKPYLYVTDCVAGLCFGLEHLQKTMAAHPTATSKGSRGHLKIFNLGPADFTSVRRIAELCVAACPYPGAEIRYTGGERGWPGDVPQSRLKPDALASAGFRVQYSSDEAVLMAVGALVKEVFG